MGEQPSSLKQFFKKVAVPVLAGLTAFTPDANVNSTRPLPSGYTEPASVDVTVPSVIEFGGEPKKPEKIAFSPQVTIIDALNEPASNDFIKKLMEETLDFQQQPEPEVAILGGITGNYQEILFNAFVNSYLSHGEKVAEVMKNVWDVMGFSSTSVELRPLQTTISSNSIKKIKDDLGNEGISISFDPKRIIDLLKDDTNHIINMSFQAGDVDIFIERYRKVIQQPDLLPDSLIDDEENIRIGAIGITVLEDGRKVYVDVDGKEIGATTPKELEELRRKNEEKAKNNTHIETLPIPLPKIVGAYTKEKVGENLPKLFEVAKAYPGKLFVAALGNESEDIRAWLKSHPNEKPSNLLLIAEWSSQEEQPVRSVFGADIYVDNVSFNLPRGSSFSTPVMTAYIEMLLRKGLTKDRAIDEIRRSCQNKSYIVDGTEERVLIFDFSQLHG